MKIIFLAKRFSPDIGGVEKHALEISKVLVNEGHDVTVITESQGPDAITGISVIRMPIFPEGKIKKFRIWLWMLQHIELFLSANIIHIHDVFFWILPIRILFAWKPIFVTFHGYETIVPPTKKSIFLRKVYEFLAWGNICVGKYLTKWYHTKTRYITYGGVDLVKNKSSHSKNKKLRILFIGRLEKDNDIQIYLAALEKLKQKKILFEFTAVGDGVLKEDVEKYGKVTGFIKNVNNYLDESDILFASSYLSILDGFADNKLVMAAYSNPLKKDYLEMTPFAEDLIISSSGEEIAEHIIQYIKRPQNFLRMINNANMFAKENSWKSVAYIYHKLWKK